MAIGECKPPPGMVWSDASGWIPEPKFEGANTLQPISPAPHQAAGDALRSELDPAAVRKAILAEMPGNVWLRGRFATAIMKAVVGPLLVRLAASEAARAAAEAERDEARADAEKAESEAEELRGTPWPEWAERCLKIVRAHSGYDGYDDAADGVDLPGELEETLNEYEAEAKKQRHEARAKHEIDRHKSAVDHYRAKVTKLCTRVDAAESRVASLTAALEEATSGRAAKADGLLHSVPSASPSVLSDVDPSRGPLLAKAREQFAYWQERVRRQKSFEECWNEDGTEHTPLGDDDAYQFGYCRGRWAEAEWWLKTIEALPALSHEEIVAEMSRRIEEQAAELSRVFPPDDRSLCECRIGQCRALTERCREPEA